MNIVYMNKNREIKSNDDVKSAGESMMDDLEELFQNILSMYDITTSDIYLDYFINKNHLCKNINIHNIYKNYRRISGPEVYDLLWSMFKYNEKEYLKSFFFLVSLPYLQE